VIGENESGGGDIFRNNSGITGAGGPPTGFSVFGTQSFANAVALSYSSAAASNLTSNNSGSKLGGGGFEDPKKNSNDATELLNGSAANNMKLIMDGFIHGDPDGYSLFPSSNQHLSFISQ